MVIRMRTAVAALCVIAAVAIGANALAAGGNDQSGSSSTTRVKPPNPPSKAQMEKMRKEMEARRNEHDKLLAEELGISVEKLQAAEDAVFKKELDQAVSDGKLTADQRDAIIKCHDNPDNCDPSKLPHGGPGGHSGPGFGPGPGGPGPGGPPPPPSGSQRSR